MGGGQAFASSAALRRPGEETALECERRLRRNEILAPAVNSTRHARRYTSRKVKDWKKRLKQRVDEEELLDESASLAEKYGMQITAVRNALLIRRQLEGVEAPI